MGLRIKLCIVFRDTVTCEGSSHLYLFYCQSRHEIQNGSPTKNVNPTSVKLFCDRVSYFHIICLSCIKAGGIQCSSGWCDPQIDLFISNDKRWAWTGLLIYSDWNATVIDGWRGPPPHSPPTPFPRLPILLPPYLLYLAQLKACLTLKGKYQTWLKLLAYLK